jgi:hypothetical protein
MVLTFRNTTTRSHEIDIPRTIAAKLGTLFVNLLAHEMTTHEERDNDDEIMLDSCRKKPPDINERKSTSQMVTARSDREKVGLRARTDEEKCCRICHVQFAE